MGGGGEALPALPHSKDSLVHPSAARLVTGCVWEHFPSLVVLQGSIYNVALPECVCCFPALLPTRRGVSRRHARHLAVVLTRLPIKDQTQTWSVSQV